VQQFLHIPLAVVLFCPLYLSLTTLYSLDLCALTNRDLCMKATARTRQQRTLIMC